MTEARVVNTNNGPTLIDPDAIAVIRAVEKHNCRIDFELNADRVAHFKRRVAERGDSPADIVIVVLDVEDAAGGALADVLMPGYDWASIRARGEKPYARGLAGRDGIAKALDAFDAQAADKLRTSLDTLRVVVVARGVAEVFDA